MRVLAVSLRDFRCYEDAEVSLGAGLTVVSGRNGAGKTNLLEALYFGCTGRSCRTTNEREVVRFGAGADARRRAGARRGRPARAGGRLRARRAQADARRRRAGRAPARRRAAAAGQRLPPRSPGAGQGCAVAAPRPPRPVRHRAVAGPGRDPPRLRPGARAAQRADRADPRRRADRGHRSAAGTPSSRRTGSR